MMYAGGTDGPPSSDSPAEGTEATKPTRRGLVLGGGGMTGMAWEVGVLAGLADAGVDVSAPDVLVGTSAGAIIGERLRRGMSPADLYAEQLTFRHEDYGDFGLRNIARLVAPRVAIRSADRARRVIGLLSSRDHDGGAQQARIARAVGHDEWPPGDFRVVAVAAKTGERRIFTRSSRVPLTTAIAASSAFPTAFPPVEIEGRLYLDGAVYSSVNADLAQGCDIVVVIAPFLPRRIHRHSVQDEIDVLGTDVRTVLVSPDHDSARALGYKILDVSRIPRLLALGRDQGRTAAARVCEVWV